MIRKSIGDKKHFKKAVLESARLIKADKSVESIQNELKDEFQEHEIKKIVSLIEKAQSISYPRMLISIVKFALWGLLAFKSIQIITILTAPEFSDMFKLFLVILSPSLLIITLFLIYKNHPFSYFAVTLLGTYSLQNSKFDGLINYPVFSLVWSIELIILLLVLISTIIGLILIIKLPIDVLKVRKILEDSGKYNADAI